MRLQTILRMTILGLALPVALWAGDPTVSVDLTGAATKAIGDVLLGKDPFTNKKAGEMVSSNFGLNEAAIYKMDGTIMVLHKDGSKTALQTGHILEKGDTLTVYDQSWVILMTRCGDKIGLDSNTTITIDEYFIAGPDRQIRLLLQKGALFLKTNNRDSRQSFFEIHAGSVVSSIGDTQSILTYDPVKSRAKIQYLEGRFSVIDKTAEHKLGVMPKQGEDDSDYTPEHSEHNWESGAMMEKNPIPLEEIDVINYRKFLDGDPRLPPPDRNMLLRGND
jgi:hypothetical protein